MKPNAAPREASPASDGLIGVVLPKEKAPGIVAVGTMKPGETYRLAPAEALRLVTAKRFEYATEEDRTRAIAYEASLKATVPAEPDAAAAAAAATDTTED